MHTFLPRVLRIGNFYSVFQVTFLVAALLTVAGCNTRPSAGGLQEAELPTPEAEPCGGDCPEGTVCVPIIDEEGTPTFACLDVHLRYCAPCLEDADCVDPFMPDAGSLCVSMEDGSGSYCATDCTEHADCPEGAYCFNREDGRALCMPEALQCECSDWAIENDSVTQCSTVNIYGTCLGKRTCTEEGLTDCDAAVAQEEACNDADDDCDGSIDESFATEGEICDGSDSDQCSDGALACDRGLVICLEDPLGRVELCNGVDDDCDDVLDNNLAEEFADNQVGVCLGSQKVCFGEAGWAEPEYSQLENFEESELTCDGLDNDCDGDVDEPFGENGTVTFADMSGLSKVLGESCGVGLCGGGTVVCGEDGETLACDSLEEALVEICDGIDNDCDGETDEGLSAPPAILQHGVCASQVQVCTGVTGWQDPSYSNIEHYEVEEISCDGLDNDCDGEVDELHSVGGSITYADAGGVSGLVLGQSCGVGLCGGGVVQCGDDALSLTCSSLGLATEEVCNGADDNCDGSVDNELSIPVADLGAGVCMGAHKVCGAELGWLEPDYTLVAGYEADEQTCDGLDNDCDGSVDEALVAPQADNQVGVCTGTNKVCQGSLGWLEPNYTQVSHFEPVEISCDGLDNNCNGEVDEGLMSPVADNQQGVCGGAQKVCGGPSGWLEPDYNAIAHFETSESLCDGRDNDCDGFADNNLTAPAAALSAGVCAGIQKTCGGVAGWQEPTYALVPGYETVEVSCDGLDNDCDGQLDESLTLVPADKQSGVCNGMQKTCNGTGGWMEPDYTVLPTYQAVEAVCDGLDNDCDAAVDEELEAPLAAYQHGVCAGTTRMCAGSLGWIEPAYVQIANFESTEMSCDGLDNDCDGNVDEQLVSPTADLSHGVCVGSVKVCGGPAGWLEPNYTAISDYVVEETQECDDLDNDCDGVVDEAFGADGVLTWIAEDGTTELSKGDDCGAGACEGGEVVCGDSGESLTCSTLLLSGSELCDAQDNDCNGLVDDIDTKPLANQQFGVCSGAQQVCGGALGWVEPAYALITGYEALEVSCDGQDNDCDGVTDNGLAAPLGNLQAGVCQGLAKTCDGQGGWLEPDYTALSQFEISEISCDDLDNDCDGTVDELYLAGGLFTYTDFDGTGGLTKGDACGVGACVGGVVTCASSGVALGCTTEGVRASDVCDGLDNDCNGVADEDFDLTSDVANCGACGNVCEFVSGVGSCDAGVCEMAGCEPGFGDCNGNTTDGCEENILSATENCGLCGQVCNPPHATGSCDDGDCSILSCDTGYADCNGVVSDGCEVHIDSDLSHCGSCSNACFANNGSPSCVGGNCGIAACDAGYVDCNGAYTDGCEVNVNADVLNCGGCNLSCANDHGSTVCANGSCVPVCSGLFADCDNQPANGCEQPIDVLNHCGACGLSCDLANANDTCAGGSCAIASCYSGYADCNAAVADGCESALASDVSNCGACGNDCDNTHGSTACVAGGCVPQCAAGWSDCDGDPTNGCETDIQTLSNCGGCGVTCDLANGSESCSTGSCSLTGCNTGYADCDSLDGNGCEVYTLNDVANCGSCGQACSNDNGGVLCSAGQCSPTCSTGFGDCDASVVNGCETQLGTLSNCSSCGDACNLANASAVCSASGCAVGSCSSGFCDANSNPVDGCEFLLDSNPLCTDWVDLDQWAIDQGLISAGGSLVRGDYNDSFEMTGLSGEYWFRTHVREGYDFVWNLSATFTVDPGNAADYDLEVYLDDPCGSVAGSSSASGGTADSVRVSWSDNWGSNDDRYVFFRVKYWSGNSCSAAEDSTFTIRVEGDT